MPDFPDPIYTKLVAAIEQLEHIVVSHADQIAALQAEIERLRSQLPGGGAGAAPASRPSWVKANPPKRENKPRKKRVAAFVRKRQEPDEIFVHSLVCCPDCGRTLPEGWEHEVREVIRDSRSHGSRHPSPDHASSLRRLQEAVRCIFRPFRARLLAVAG